MTTRINFSLLLIALILINFKIILINEETLILICFSVFCFLFSTRLSNNVEHFFKSQAETTKSELVNSSVKLISTTEIKKKKLQTTNAWPHVFSNLRTDFKAFNSFVLTQFNSFYQAELQKKIHKKLEFSARLELQLTKMFILVITEKLQKFVKLQNFFNGVLKVSSFKTIKKIYFREHLQKLTK